MTSNNQEKNPPVTPKLASTWQDLRNKYVSVKMIAEQFGYAERTVIKHTGGLTDLQSLRFHIDEKTGESQMDFLIPYGQIIAETKDTGLYSDAVGAHTRALKKGRMIDWWEYKRLARGGDLSLARSARSATNISEAKLHFTLGLIGLGAMIVPPHIHAFFIPVFMSAPWGYQWLRNGLRKYYGRKKLPPRRRRKLEKTYERFEKAEKNLQERSLRWGERWAAGTAGKLKARTAASDWMEKVDWATEKAKRVIRKSEKDFNSAIISIEKSERAYRKTKAGNQSPDDIEKARIRLEKVRKKAALKMTRAKARAKEAKQNAIDGGGLL